MEENLDCLRKTQKWAVYHATLSESMKRPIDARPVVVQNVVICGGGAQITYLQTSASVRMIIPARMILAQGWQKT